MRLWNVPIMERRIGEAAGSCDIAVSPGEPVTVEGLRERIEFYRHMCGDDPRCVSLTRDQIRELRVDAKELLTR